MIAAPLLSHQPKAQLLTTPTNGAVARRRVLHIQYQTIIKDIHFSSDNVQIFEHILYQSFKIPTHYPLMLTLNDSLVIFPLTALDLNEAEQAWKCELQVLPPITTGPVVSPIESDYVSSVNPSVMTQVALPAPQQPSIQATANPTIVKTMLDAVDMEGEVTQSSRKLIKNNVSSIPPQRENSSFSSASSGTKREDGRKFNRGLDHRKSYLTEEKLLLIILKDTGGRTQTFDMLSKYTGVSKGNVEKWCSQKGRESVLQRAMTTMPAPGPELMQACLSSTSSLFHASPPNKAMMSDSGEEEREKEIEREKERERLTSFVVYLMERVRWTYQQRKTHKNHSRETDRENAAERESDEDYEQLLSKVRESLYVSLSISLPVHVAIAHQESDALLAGEREEYVNVETERQGPAFKKRVQARIASVSVPPDESVGLGLGLNQGLGLDEIDWDGLDIDEHWSQEMSSHDRDKERAIETEEVDADEGEESTEDVEDIDDEAIMCSLAEQVRQKQREKQLIMQSLSSNPPIPPSTSLSSQTNSSPALHLVSDITMQYNDVLSVWDMHTLISHLPFQTDTNDANMNVSYGAVLVSSTMSMQARRPLLTDTRYVVAKRMEQLGRERALSASTDQSYHQI